MTNIPRVGLAGFSAGSIYHAPLIADAGGELVAISTSNPGRTAQARAEYPAAQIVPDLAALLELDLDLVILTTPTNLHYEHVARVLEAGRACVVEKPFTVRVVEAKELAAKAVDLGVPLTVFQNRRFDDGIIAAKQAIESGDLGDVHRFDFNWERWRPVPKDRWRENSSWSDGGGLLLDLGPHLVDSALYLFGPVVNVRGEVRSLVTHADDDVFIAMRHENGVISHLSASTAAAQPLPRLRVLGRKGAFVYTDFEENAVAYPEWCDESGQCGWLVQGSERRSLPMGQGAHVDYYRAVFAALSLTDPVAAQAAMPVQLGDAIAVMEVLEAVRETAL